MTCLHAATTCPDCAPLTPAELRDLMRRAHAAAPAPCCSRPLGHDDGCDGLDRPAMVEVDARYVERLVREVRASRVLLAGRRP